MVPCGIAVDLESTGERERLKERGKLLERARLETEPCLERCIGRKTAEGECVGEVGLRPDVGVREASIRVGNLDFERCLGVPGRPDVVLRDLEARSHGALDRADRARERAGAMNRQAETIDRRPFGRHDDAAPGIQERSARS